MVLATFLRTNVSSSSFGAGKLSGGLPRAFRIAGSALAELSCSMVCTWARPPRSLSLTSLATSRPWGMKRNISSAASFDQNIWEAPATETSLWETEITTDTMINTHGCSMQKLHRRLYGISFCLFFIFFISFYFILFIYLFIFYFIFFLNFFI